MEKVWTSALDRDTKLTFSESILLNGPESWTVTCNVEDRIDRRYIQFLLRMLACHRARPYHQLYGNPPPLSFVLRRTRCRTNCMCWSLQVFSNLVVWRPPRGTVTAGPGKEVMTLICSPRIFSSNGVYFFVMWTVNKLVGKLSRAFVYKGGRHTRGARHPIRTNHNAAARKRGQQPNIRRWRAEVVVHVFFVQIEIADNTKKPKWMFASQTPTIATCQQP
ncbi:hypothetical protein LSAT2_030446 [Lamellibrachia satsuma]|nr:hypothetical protein LSAT2_030446 [Lamellibrachia satsuma]